MKTTNQNKILITAMIVFIIIVVIGFLRTETEKKPVLKEQGTNPTYLYDFYLTSKPNIQSRPYYGDQNAALTLIIYADLHSDSMKHFMDEIMPRLKEEYIHTQKMRYYHKHHLTQEDLREASQAYSLAKTLECFREQEPEQYYDFYFAIHATPHNELPQLLRSYDIGWEDYKECMEEREFREIIEDISEVDNFGMIGVTPRIYIGIDGRDLSVIDGVPSYQRIQQVIRNYQIQLGD